PVEAWENIASDPEKRQQYVNARGRGGFVRANWKDSCEIIASASIYTIKNMGLTELLDSVPSQPCQWSAMRQEPVSYHSSAAQSSVSMIGMLTYRLLHHRFGVSRPMFQKVLIGTTRNIILSGEPTCHKHAHQMPTLWLKHVTTERKSLVSVRTMRNMKNSRTYGCRPGLAQTVHWPWP